MLLGVCCRLMQQIVSDVMCNNLVEPIEMIVSERTKHLARCSSCSSGGDATTCSSGRSSSKMALVTRFRSIYRDILFLAFAALGQPNIHIGKFSSSIHVRFSFSDCNCKFFRLHRMHEMQTIVTDDRSVCP